MKKFSTMIAAAAGSAIFAFSPYALAFGGGGHGHGSPALMACMVAAPASVKTNLKTTFHNSTIHTDRQAVETARGNLAQAILAKNTSLGTYETALSQAQLKVLQDEDGIAQNVCGQLSSAQLAAASTLYSNLQSSRESMRGAFQAARQASGDSTSNATGEGTAE
jgi:hypothetical protein